MKKTVVFLSACLSLAHAGRAADEWALAGRTLVKERGEAVITVKLVVEHSMSMGGQERNVEEEKTEATGTVIDSKGLTVVSLTMADPSAMVHKLMASAGDGSVPPEMNFDVKITDAKLLLADGREIPASMVLRDKDLDLAFLRPSQPVEEAFPFLDLTPAREVELLEPVFVLSRMAQVGARKPAISMDRVHALIEKPRRFYVLDQQMAAASKLGAPVFTADGAPVGLLVLRTVATAGSGMNSMFGGMDAYGLLPIVLPAADILDVANQAPEESEAESAPAEGEAAPAAEPEAAPPAEAPAAEEGAAPAPAPEPAPGVAPEPGAG